MWKGWERNMVERRGPDRSTQAIKERKKEGEGLKYERNHSY
jgi:hypothetical protein